MKKIITIALLFTLPLVSCKKWLDQPPTGSLREDLFNTASDAQETLNSCYDALANLYDGRIQSISELLSDNLLQPNTNNDLRSVYARQTTFFNSTTNKVYQDLYTVIWRCNTLIDNIDLIPDISESEKTRLVAEARFLRGFCHWSAVKLWAQPYDSDTDNSHPGVPIRDKAAADPLLRSSVKEVYDFVITDIKFAFDNLPETNSIYATKHSASGVLANVYFLMNDYDNAITYCNNVINSGMFNLLPDLNRYPPIAQGENMISEFVFGTVSTLFDPGSGSLALDRRNGTFFGNYQVNNGIAELMLSEEFATFLNLNQADQRIGAWTEVVGNRSFLKRFYEEQVYSIPIIHLTELKLIRAEAQASKAGGDLGEARADINDILNRAFEPGTNEIPESATAEQIKQEARKQYRIETIGEGKYVDQLRRRGALGETVIIRGAPYNCPGMAIQFPNAESTVIGFELNPEGGCN
jgi:starch-binding outer membrane protein, SusD/RagB family